MSSRSNAKAPAIFRLPGDLEALRVEALAVALKYGSWEALHEMEQLFCRVLKEAPNA